MNYYKEYLLKKLNEHLEQVIRDDNYEEKKGQYIQDFFDFTLNEIKLTTSELVNSLENRNILNEILFSPYKKKYPQSEKWFELFEKDYIQNLHFFQSALNICLKEHVLLLKNTAYNNEIELNTKKFIKLLQLGKESGHFQKINSEDLSTSYGLYQEILKQEGITTNTYHENDFKKILEKNGNIAYLYNYLPEVLETLKKEEFLESLSSAQVIKLTHALMDIKDPDKKEIQTVVLKELLTNNQVARKNIKYEEMWFIFQELIPSYFNATLPSEKQSLLNVNYNFPKRASSEMYGHNFQTFLNKGLSYDNTRKGIYFDLNVIDKIFKFWINNDFGANTDNIKIYQDKYTITAISHNIKMLENISDTHEKTQKINEIVQNFNNNNNYFHFQVEDNLNNTNISGYLPIYNFLKENAPEGEATKWKNKFNQEMRATLETLKKENYYSYEIHEEYKKIKTAIKSTGNHLDYLQNINDLDLWFLNISEKEGKKTTNLPLIFKLLENKNEDFFKEIIKEPILSKLSVEKSKNKNIMSFLLDKPFLLDYLKILAEDKVVAKQLILDNKKVYTQLLEHTNKNVSTIVSYLKLDSIVKKNEKVVKSLKI